MAFQKIPANRIPSARKCAMALQAIIRQHTISKIARNFHCSRTTVHMQKNWALKSGANDFKDAADDETLFTIPVTRSFIHQMVVGLFCICNSSYRGIMRNSSA